jgi:putative DNA primase/helicase
MTKQSKGSAAPVPPTTFNGNLQQLPAALVPLTTKPNWVLWKWEKKKSKWTKPPYQPNGKHAQNNNPETWSNYTAVCAVATKYSGIGFSLTNTDVAAFDIDGCRDPKTGTIAAWATALVERCNSYTEITPSGTGLRIIGLATGEAVVHRKLPVSEGITVEPYRRATRYITITGNPLPEFDIALSNIDAHIDAVVAELDSKKKKKQNGSATVVQGLAEDDNYKLPRELLNMLYLQGDHPADYPTRSQLFYAFIKTALRKAIDENIIINACLDEKYKGCSIHSHVEDNGGEAYVKRQIERAANDEELTEDGDQRQIIKFVAGELDLAWRATQEALIKVGAPIYVRGGHLVQPIWRLETIPQDNREVLTAQFVRLNVPRLTDIVGHHAACFFRFDRRVNKWFAMDPPRPVMETLLEIKHWHFPTVVGIVNAPTMRADGTLVTEPGYDRATQLWYKPSDDIKLPPIAERPSKKDAAAALAKLDELLKGFPFGEDKVSRSVALAGILTTVLRGVFHAAPIFLIVAPEPRTGKTYLVQLISHIATGHGAMPIAGSDNPEEMEKRIETAALSGRGILHLNNLPNGMALESEALSQLSTEGYVTIRKLGRHEEGLCDCRATTTFVNGNNILVAADLVPRTLVCRLNAETAEPERRQFDFDPIARVCADRGAYLAACFTIARAFIAANPPQPTGMHKVAGYEPWSRYIQQPLMWLGMADPYGNIQTARAMDPSLEDFHQLLDVLKRYRNELGEQFRVSDCVRLAEELTSDSSGRPTYRRFDLRELMTFHGKINAKSFGRLLMRHRDRIHEDWSIKFIHETRDGVAAYCLQGPPGHAPAVTGPQT